jgi:hypothetical protein
MAPVRLSGRTTITYSVGGVGFTATSTSTATADTYDAGLVALGSAAQDTVNKLVPDGAQSVAYEVDSINTKLTSNNDNSVINSGATLGDKFKFYKGITVYGSAGNNIIDCDSDQGKVVVGNTIDGVLMGFDVMEGQPAFQPQLSVVGDSDCPAGIFSTTQNVAPGVLKSCPTLVLDGKTLQYDISEIAPAVDAPKVQYRNSALGEHSNKVFDSELSTGVGYSITDKKSNMYMLGTTSFVLQGIDKIYDGAPLGAYQVNVIDYVGDSQVGFTGSDRAIFVVGNDSTAYANAVMVGGKIKLTAEPDGVGGFILCANGKKIITAE